MKLALVFVVACTKTSPAPTPAPTPNLEDPTEVASEAPSAAPIDAARCTLSSADVAAIKANVPLLKRGMSHAQVYATLGNDMHCALGGAGQGSAENFVLYTRLDGATQLALHWEMRDGSYALLSAEIR